MWDASGAVISGANVSVRKKGGTWATVIANAKPTYKIVAGWRRLVRKVARVVREMPLWRLQSIGAEQLNFLYENQGDVGVIHLLPGIANDAILFARVIDAPDGFRRIVGDQQGSVGRNGNKDARVDHDAVRHLSGAGLISRKRLA